jgi:hypothetical protein
VPFEQFNLNMALVVAATASASALGITIRIKQVVESAWRASRIDPAAVPRAQ